MTEPKRLPITTQVKVSKRPDGTILLDSVENLPPVEGTIFGKLEEWANRTPDSVWLSEGDRQLSFGEGHALRRKYSSHLMAAGASQNRPLMVISNNGIEHALVSLAASAINVPVAVVLPAYCSPNFAPWTKLDHVLSCTNPGLIITDIPRDVARALSELGHDCPVAEMAYGKWCEDLPQVDSHLVDEGEASVTLDSVSKLLFTSGSTGMPKPVINTQRMMVSNMVATGMVWPFLREKPPVMVDWLPWNHTFGGNYCFNVALWFGGHMHIDFGKPAPGLFEQSLAAIRRFVPNIYFNVPLGYELLASALEADEALAKEFFSQLDFLLNAGAAMPVALRKRLTRIAVNACGKEPRIVGGWGSTETAPFSTVLDMETDRAANLGLPIPGTTIKMIPLSGNYELRIKGPNVTPGYYGDPEATAAAFDEEGFYKIGDAGKFVDENDPSKGIVFDGRVSENFKLSSATFVNVGKLRLDVVSACGKLISDAVIAGEGRDEIGLVIIPNEPSCRDFLEQNGHDETEAETAGLHPAIAEQLAHSLRALNEETGSGASRRIARFIVAKEPPSVSEGEITEKGYIAQRRFLDLRRALVEELYLVGHEL